MVILAIEEEGNSHHYIVSAWQNLRNKRIGFYSLLRKAKSSGLFWVALCLAAIVGITFGATWWLWPYLSKEETPTNILQNMTFVAAAFATAVFAFWRISVAKGHVELAKQEHYHTRFQRASMLLAKQGTSNSHARISGLHAFRYLIIDAPELSLEAIEVITSFLIQTPVDDDHAVSELTLAKMTAEFICDTIENKRILDVRSIERLRSEVAYAIREAAKNFVAAGRDPFERPVR